MRYITPTEKKNGTNFLQKNKNFAHLNPNPKP